jgi:hypothetical protein
MITTRIFITYYTRMSKRFKNYIVILSPKITGNLKNLNQLNIRL